MAEPPAGRSCWALTGNVRGRVPCVCWLFGDEFGEVRRMDPGSVGAEALGLSFSRREAKRMAQTRLCAGQLSRFGFVQPHERHTWRVSAMGVSIRVVSYLGMLCRWLSVSASDERAPACLL
jgi:hypothetical protein